MGRSIGRRQEIERLVREHHERAYAYAFRLTGRSHDAEDLVQQAFLQAQRNYRQLRQDGASGAWLAAIVRNLWLKELRRRGRRGETAPLVDVAADAGEPPLDDADELQAALRRLDDDHRTVLLMHYFEDRPYRQIAETLHVPLGTVMSRLHRARSRLKIELESLSSPKSHQATTEAAVRETKS